MTAPGRLAALTAALALAVVPAQAQRGGGATVTEPAEIECPSPLGEGLQTMRSFCDVLIGNDPAQGILVRLPRRTGDLVLTFDLHNRHTYSEDLIEAGRAYRQYAAGIGVLTPNNDLLSRFAIVSEFRSAADLLDRVSGGAGPGGVKAVAPVGSEPVRLVITGNEDTVSILGEKLEVVRPDGGPDVFVVPGRPIAIISNVMVEYRPRR